MWVPDMSPNDPTTKIAIKARTRQPTDHWAFKKVGPGPLQTDPPPVVVKGRHVQPLVRIEATLHCYGTGAVCRSSIESPC